MSIIEFLNIKEEHVSSEAVTLSLSITEELLQPYGLMHGGVSALLAETAASMGAKAWLKTSDKLPVGTDIQTRHLKSMGLGTIIATAKPIKTGKTLHVWSVEIHNDTNNLISYSTCSLMIVERR